jgi:hypothetical protein
MEYIGIADCHGLESFTPARQYNAEEEAFTMNNKAVAFMTMRANANRQRHAVVFKVKVNTEVADEIFELIDQGEYTEALTYLKDNADEVALVKSSMGNAEKSWNMIPNPDLDPFH